MAEKRTAMATAQDVKVFMMNVGEYESRIWYDTCMILFEA